MGAEPFEQQQFETAGVEGVKPCMRIYDAELYLIIHTCR